METKFTEADIEFLKTKGLIKNGSFYDSEDDSFVHTELDLRNGHYFIDIEYFDIDDDNCYYTCDYVQFESEDNQSLEDFINEHY